MVSFNNGKEMKTKSESSVPSVRNKVAHSIIRTIAEVSFDENTQNTFSIRQRKVVFESRTMAAVLSSKQS